MKDESMRQQKIGRLIQKELANLFQSELQSYFLGRMATITKSRISADLSVAKCYISVFPGSGTDVVKNLNKKSSNIRFKLGNLLRNNLRQIPELQFYLDDSLDYIENIDKLLQE